MTAYYGEKTAEMGQENSLILVTNESSTGGCLKKGIIGLGCVQMLLGLTMIAVFIPTMVNDMILSDVGYGIWGGIFFIITGLVGVCAGIATKWRHPMVAHMVLSIIAAVVAAFLLILAVLNLILDGLTAGSCGYYGNSKHCKVNESLGIVQVIISLVEFVVAIVAASLTCGVTCACCAGCCQ